MRNLITVDDYKTYATISSSDQDEKIELLIPFISQLIKNYCTRSFIDNYDVDTESFTDIIQYYNGGDNYVYTEEFPILSVEEIATSEDNGQTYTNVLVEYTDYLIDKQNDRLMIFGAEDINYPNYFKITYKAGYSVLPGDLYIAALDLLPYYMKGESSPRKTQSSVSIEYIRSSDFPHHIKRVLDLYRVIR
jgi:hypothetical protein